MMWTLGMTYTKMMNPKLTTLLIAADVKDIASAKVASALE